jgi:hypothetical protein
VGKFTCSSLVALLDAAAASPTAAHRGPSYAHLFHAVVQRRGGATPARAGDLDQLVTGIADIHRNVSMLEDFEPYDSREKVVVRWGTGLFRLISGSLERPTAMVGEQYLLASVIDRVLVPSLGFGLSDIGEVILRRIDQVAGALAECWPVGPVSDRGDDPSLTQAEVDAVSGLLSVDSLVQECTYPDRAAAAVARYTVAVRDLRCDPSAPVATFGTAIVTRSRGTVTVLPAAFLVEALPAIGTELAAIASGINSRANSLFSQVAGHRVARLLQGSAHSIAGPIQAGQGSTIHSLVFFNRRQILALDVASGLTPDVIQSRLDAGSRTLNRVRPASEVSTPGGDEQIPEDAEIVRAHVIAGPHLGVPFGLNHPALMLEDLEWILHTSHESPEDLWYFIRDLTQPSNVREMFAWDLIDRWEVWRPQKSFYRGGVPLTGMFFAPHAAAAEWENAVSAAPTERALHALGLPPLRDWPAVLNNRRGTEIGDIRTDTMYQILPQPIPVAVAKTDPSAPHELNTTLWRLAESVVWKLNHSMDAFHEAAARSGLDALRIVFELQDRDSGPPLTVVNMADGVLSIGWDARLQAALAENSFAVEKLTGEVVTHAMTAAVRDQFVAAWDVAPPGIRVDGYTVRQRAQRLPEPLPPHTAVRSDVLRQLGEHLAATNHEPAVLQGADATRLESQTVFPWLVTTFHKTIHRLAEEELLTFALAQLECVHHQRLMLDKELSWQRGFPTRGATDGSERLGQVLRSIRIISFIVEEVLAHPPAGTAPVDDYAWTEALSIAELCIESCFRSDAIHQRLTHTAVEITSYFEIKVAHSDEPTDVDVDEYNRLRTVHTLPEGTPIATAQNEPPDDHDEPQPMVERMPALRPIDDAMRATLGFGIDAVTGALNVATQWDTDTDTSATLTTPDTVIEQCAEHAVGATRDEHAAALDWLTLRGDDLAHETIPHWETERRVKRVATSPFIASFTGLWVLPWTAEHTLRIFAAYLGDGRLPWPATTLPAKVNQALNQYRQKQNREAEKECIAILADGELVVRAAIKPQKARHYGIAKLSGEIDALCIDASRSRMWVIEVKDSYIPYSSYQIRRLVNTFSDEGKYVDQLLAKVGDIEASAPSLASTLNLPNPSREWTVMGLMATRHLEPAAFAVNPRVAFCVIADVLGVVCQDQLPTPGLHGAATALDDVAFPASMTTRAKHTHSASPGVETGVDERQHVQALEQAGGVVQPPPPAM